MLLIEIHGLPNGKHDVHLEEKVEAKGNFSSFMHPITVIGILKVIGERIIFEGKAETKVNLTCDLSLEDYTDSIESDLNISIIKGASLDEIESEENKDNKIFVGEDEKHADITSIVLQELAISIPMKKVAPQYRDKEIDEIYPELFDDKEEKPIEGTAWEELKKLKSN